MTGENSSLIPFIDAPRREIFRRCEKFIENIFSPLEYLPHYHVNPKYERETQTSTLCMSGKLRGWVKDYFCVHDIATFCVRAGACNFS